MADDKAIVVTPRMIEAGEIALLHLQACVPASYLVEQVYIAMALAASAERAFSSTDLLSSDEKSLS